MKKFETHTGYIDSEMERAALGTGIFPQESALERDLKARIAKVFAWIAAYIDPEVIKTSITPSQTSQC